MSCHASCMFDFGICLASFLIRFRLPSHDVEEFSFLSEIVISEFLCEKKDRECDSSCHVKAS